MKILITLITFSLGLLFSNEAKAQRGRDSVQRVAPKLSAEQEQQRQKNYYRRTLKVDSLQAEQVNKIQQEYKAAMKVVEGDQSLNGEAKRARFKALIEDKNKKLEKILSPEQQEKMIPDTERGKSKGLKQEQ